MSIHELYRSDYLEWMCQLVSDKTFKSINYSRLLNHLNRVEFVYCMPLDGNRAADGVDIRYRYEDECGEAADPVMVAFFGEYSCSVMEMMVALALRCEENIMSNQEFGDRTGLWFWSMISSLGLANMADRTFDECYVNEVLSKWMNRDHAPTGEGSLFAIPNSDYDLRTIEIWGQLNWYLKTVV